MSDKVSNLKSDDDVGIKNIFRHLPDNLAASQILASLPNPVFVLDSENQFQFLNHAAEMFFQSSQSIVFAQALQSFIAADSPLFSMLIRARNQNRSVADQGLELAGPRVGYKLVNVQITPFDGKGSLLVTMQERALAERLRGQSLFRGAARSVTSMAAMLAHEVKNPLAGIKGAAQLLEADLEANETNLTRMIVEETDRVTALLDRMEGFAGGASVVMTTVNIHEVLDHCLELAAASYGAHLSIKRAYDPSLPFVEGHRDLLIQAFINIIKNASEATDKNGELIIKTSYAPGRRLSITSIAEQLHVPIQVEVIDNGRGIPEDIRDHLFDPFVSGRVGGSGLGLAMVASVIADHGGLMEVETVTGETVFRLNFPATTAQQTKRAPKNEETAL
ncbi:ATP-binding protein [uncultured Candidatus Puniceispirillum sp.]|jgi:two-component system, NtrC family, nitrogen regulation sensor histidine kinase GlnL|uniref:two-component system sensor histidine kinase NtrB n=2 Tax=Candidatus Puniceispirillum TaxID=767891 RepID=UPI0032B2B2F2